jgi:hypothetical protein
MALALVILVDLIHRSRHLELFYTDEGLYPVAAYEETYRQFTGLSVHALSGDLWFQQLLFVVSGLFALAFLVGYRTRLMGLLSFLLLFSLHARNPALLNGGDKLFRVLLAVALVTPLGERWSVDALRRGSARSTVASFGTLAVLLQPVVVFTSNAILKHRGDLWYAGDGLELALSNDAMRFLLGNVIVESPRLMTALNYGWVTLLAGSSVLLLGTVGRARAVAALAYICAFLGMLSAMAVGLFPLVLIASMIPFLTTPFWDAVAARVPSGWRDRLPSKAQLGPLGRPPLERRLLDRLEERGHSGVAALPRVAMGGLGFLVVVWILLYAGADVVEYTVPDQLEYDHLDQQDWGLYAPDPLFGYNYYVHQAELVDGSTVGALSNGTVDFDRPPDGSVAYDTFRHRKYMNLVWWSGDGSSHPMIADRYAAWVCEQASDTYDRRVVRVTVYRMYQPIPLDGEYEEPSRHLTVRERCG